MSRSAVIPSNPSAAPPITQTKSKDSPKFAPIAKRPKNFSWQQQRPKGYRDEWHPHDESESLKTAPRTQISGLFLAVAHKSK